MQFLIDFAAENDEFRGILERSAKFPTVQGVVLDIDRLWMRLWAIRQSEQEDSAENLLRRYFDWPFVDWRDIYPGPNVFAKPLTMRDVESWRPQAWHFMQERLGKSTKRSPILVKVCLRPRLTPDETYPTMRDLYEGEGRLQVSIETRSRAQLTSNPRKAYSPLLGGVSIGVGATDYGSLGVILKDVNGIHYGLTCSHVARHPSTVVQPSQRDSSSGVAIGKTVISSNLSNCPPGTKCNPWSGAVANEVDASLIRIDAQKVPALLEVLDVGPLTGIMSRSSISTTQAVDVMGRTSGLNSMQVGGLAAWYTFAHAGTDYCFKNLFEVESPYGTAGVIRPGDSGAPVCAAGAAGTEWAGMIAGRDSFKGYAIYAETVEQWLLRKNYTLQVT